MYNLNVFQSDLLHTTNRQKIKNAQTQAKIDVLIYIKNRVDCKTVVSVLHWTVIAFFERKVWGACENGE